MALFIFRFVFFSIMHLVHGLSVDFFYSPLFNYCSFSQTSLNATNLSAHGGICAYIPDTQRLYACPAPDPQCWTWNKVCKDGGANQTTCTGDGAAWCCEDYEKCSTTPSICKSSFLSPNSGVNISVANSKELEALGVTTITSTIPAANPTPFSTLTLASSSASASITSSSSATGSPGSKQISQNSKGAIAGIVIGSIAGLSLILAGVFMLWLRQRRQKAEPKADASENNESKDNTDITVPELLSAPIHEKDSTVAIPEIGEFPKSELADKSYTPELP